MSFSGFARVETRYDCVWTRACTLFDSADAYGRRAEKLPNRLNDGHRAGRSYQLPTGDRRHYYGVADRDELGIEYGVPVSLGGLRGAPNPNFPPPPEVFGRRANRNPLELFQVPGFDGLFGISGPFGIDPADAMDPINFFKNVVIKQRGEIEVKDSFAERNDAIVLRALTDSTVVVANALPEKKADVGLNPTTKGRPAHILVRVFS